MSIVATQEFLYDITDKVKTILDTFNNENIANSLDKWEGAVESDGTWKKSFKICNDIIEVFEDFDTRISNTTDGYLTQLNTALELLNNSLYEKINRTITTSAKIDLVADELQKFIDYFQVSSLDFESRDDFFERSPGYSSKSDDSWKLKEAILYKERNNEGWTDWTSTKQESEKRFVKRRHYTIGSHKNAESQAPTFLQNNEWKPEKDWNDNVFREGNQAINLYGEDERVIERYSCLVSDIPKDIRAKVQSNFEIFKNQPFAITFGFSKMPLAYQEWVGKRSEVEDGRDWSSALGKVGEDGTILYYPRNKRMNPVIEIEWGNVDGEDDTAMKFNLTIYWNLDEPQGHLFRWNSEYQRWDKVGNVVLSVSGLSPKAVGSINNAATIVFYPLADTLYLLPAQMAGGKSAVDILGSFSFQHFINIPRSKITIRMFGAEGFFKFNPVAHEPRGLFLSPPMDCNFKSEPEVMYTRVNHLMKASLSYEGDSKQFNEYVDIPIPDPKDKKNTFEYVSNCKIEKKIFQRGDVTVESDEENIREAMEKWIGDGSDYQYKYIIRLRSDAQSAGGPIPIITGKKYFTHLDDASRIYSPALAIAETHIKPSLREIVGLSNNDDTFIRNSDVEKVSVTHNLEGLSCSVTLNNRFSFPSRLSERRGRYTFVQGTNMHSGIKPIRVRCGIGGGTTGSESDENAFKIHFRGYIMKREPSRASPGGISKMALSCVDRSIKLKQQLGFNLPIYDGWCHLSAIYHTAHLGGFTDDEILYYQNPINPDEKVKLTDLLVGDFAVDKGSCFEGHVGGFPEQNRTLTKGIIPEVVHTCLGTAMMKDQPIFMPQMGTSLWDVLKSFADYTGWFLYVNAFGNLIYQPGEIALNYERHELDVPFSSPSTSGSRMIRNDLTVVNPYFSFREQTNAPGEYNEIQREFRRSFSHEHARNMLVAMGLPQIGRSGDVHTFAPIIVKHSQENWPDNYKDEINYIPWLSVAYVRDPMWSDLHRLQMVAQETWDRSNRPFIVAGWSAWGQPGLYPYMIVEVNEELGREVQGKDGGQHFSGISNYIVTSVTHELDGESKAYFTSIEGERFSPYDYSFSPDFIS